MWLAKNFLKDDEVISLHSDLFYDPKLIKKIIEVPNSGVLVNQGFISKKDFNAEIKNGRIIKIGVKLKGENRRFCLPIFKFLKNDFQKLMKKIDEFAKSGKTSYYAEEAFNEISDKIELYSVYFNKEFAMEIDDFVDLKKAEIVLVST